MPVLEPDLDAYGRLARRTALADILELQALRDVSSSAAELADFVRDSQWLRRLNEPFNLPVGLSSLGDDEDSADEVEEEALSPAVEKSLAFADQVFSELSERVTVLGAEYPFALVGSRLRYTGPADLRHPYLVLLGVTLSHAYSLPLSFDPRQYFEDLATQSLQLRGLLAANIALERRGRPDLSSALVAVGQSCRLRPTPDAAVTRVAAQEEGVDIVAHLFWGDSRPLHWVFVVQATCAVSDVWRYKLKEPAVPMWKKLLGLSVSPLAVLAVPHHVPFDTLAYLVEQDEDRFVLDRLRLYHPLLPLRNRAAEILDALGSASVQLAL